MKDLDKPVFPKTFDTIRRPERTPVGFFRSKSTTGGAIGAVSVLIGTVVAGAIAANNPDRVDPATQRMAAGAITAVVAGVLSGVWNWLRHRR